MNQQSQPSILRAAVRKTRSLAKLCLKDPMMMVGWLSRRGREQYMFMQKSQYQMLAADSRYETSKVIDHVVGSYEEHDRWTDYDDYLMKYVDESFKSKMALDFGCGPGRNMVKYCNRFRQLDGADISEQNLENARSNLRNHRIPIPGLFVTRGDDLGAVAENHYDIIISTIAMQHVCVHEIRYSILTAMHRALKIGGRISIQMGFGKDSPDTVGYYENNYATLETNRGCDTVIDDPEKVRSDLEKIGYSNFEYWIRPVGPGDYHPNWIYFTAVKG